MKILARFLIISVLYFFTFCFCYSIAPLFSLFFYGSFKAVASCGSYTFVFTIICAPLLIALFSSFLNEDLTVKN